MTAESIVMIISAVTMLISAIATIITLYNSKKKNIENVTQKDVETKLQFVYIQNSLDEIRLGQKEGNIRLGNLEQRLLVAEKDIEYLKKSNDEL